MADIADGSDWRHGTAGAATTLTDFSGKTQNVNMSEEMAEKEYQVINNGAVQYLPGSSTGTIDATYLYDATIKGQLSAIKSSRLPVDFQLSPLGTASGAPRSTGEMIMTSMENAIEAGEIIGIDVTWRISGEVTDDTHP